MAIKVPDELLMAYADGELPPDEATALEALLREDADLRARLEPFTITRRQLASLFAHRLHEPVPDRLIAAIAAAPLAPRARPAHASVLERIREFVSSLDVATVPFASLPAYAAGLVALFAFGATAGWLAGRADSPAPELIAAAGPHLVASGALATALESSPSHTTLTASEGLGSATIVPLISFRNHEDGVCRTYRIQGGKSAPSYAGIACRARDGTWNVPLHVEVKDTAVPGSGYQTAGDLSVPAIEATVGTLIAGDALGPDDESALLKNGWRGPAS